MTYGRPAKQNAARDLITNLEVKYPFEKSNGEILEIKKPFEKSNGEILEIKKPFEKSNGEILEIQKTFEKSNGEILEIKSHLRNQTRNKINQIKLLPNQN